MGYQVDVAADGVEGVEQGLAHRPRAALIDLGLPRLDGYDVARRLRAEYGDDILLVAYTGYGNPEDRERSRQAGFDAHLVKSADAAELFRWLGGREGRS
jgi:CheY-like chemotaxis protein